MTTTAPLRFTRLGGSRYQNKVTGFDIYIQQVEEFWYLTIDDYDAAGNGREYVEYGDAIFTTKRDAVAYATEWAAAR